jgi:thiamine pyrophosphate-dependent acetolactate synthase large subunit-like protein
LRVVVIDNERYGETGQQETHTAYGVDLAAIAAGCGFAHTRTVREMAEVETLRVEVHAAHGPLFAVVKVAADEIARVLPPRDGAYLTQRMREAVLGAGAAGE